MSTKQVNADSLIEILAEYNVEIDYETAEKVSEDFQSHLSMMNEMDSYRVASYEPKVDTSLTQRIKDLEKEVEAYKNSVKQRRNADVVWLDGDRVMYE
ncbi:MAG: hypothetical protein L0G02_08145 [Lactococcus lactis]|nr:hypothetical protein [Chryseobacterium sp.]MDN5470373.1 hypothetical protein [Lactococcus lactis]